MDNFLSFLMNLQTSKNNECNPSRFVNYNKNVTKRK